MNTLTVVLPVAEAHNPWRLKHLMQQDANAHNLLARRYHVKHAQQLISGYDVFENNWKHTQAMLNHELAHDQALGSFSSHTICLTLNRHRTTGFLQLTQAQLPVEMPQAPNRQALKQIGFAAIAPDGPLSSQDKALFRHINGNMLNTLA
jgi:hypothetical protein